MECNNNVTRVLNTAQKTIGDFPLLAEILKKTYV